MENLFHKNFTHEELVTVILTNPILLNEIELELTTLWYELSHYNDEEWEEISEKGKDDVREVRIYLPRVGETLTLNKLDNDEAIFIKLGQIISKITGLTVKKVYLANDTEFEVEFSNPIPRPYIRKPVGKC